MRAPSASRVVSVADRGRVMSPRTATSQVRGGVVWGIGATLREASAKELGEVSMTGVAPAIANAVFLETGRRLRELPIRIEHFL